ncbi:unnamed protein product [Paramecium pentaurelia]|uniref:Phosducin domain-containing protein n=1 Tax=Paramecium pentaurelia TaxID=43138 RepID=A0A8S1VQP2_9CILI|nr:unnamed protein product [Paramecium pentaurelia]
MANGVTTEWEDIHVKHGNYVEREKVTTLAETYQQAIQKLDEKQDSDDDFFEDDEFTKQYKNQRLQQMMEQAQKKLYGEVYEISRDEYVKQVTEASKDRFVVLSLYQDYIIESLKLNEVLQELAKQYKEIKFVKMVATKCIENFPDDQCPCFIIYKDTKAVSNIPFIHKLRKITFASIEDLLISQGVIPKPVEEDEQYEEIKDKLKHPYKTNNVKDVDDEIDDREYSHKVQFQKPK